MNTYKQISIAILCGGWSKEREISLLSGITTYNCLKDNVDRETTRMKNIDMIQVFYQS